MKIFLAFLSIVSLADSLFNGLSIERVNSINNKKMDFGDILASKTKSEKDKTLVVLGTYAADFNAIEYGQRIRHYLPRLKEKGVNNVIMVMNASPSAITAFSKLLDLPEEVELYSDPTGMVGKSFGVCRGYNPDDKATSPYLKLFLMLFGLGAYATLPSVISGYIGNPFSPQPWIESSLAQGQLAGRWPNNVLEIDKNGKVLKNKFSELPAVGKWGRRPLELATLRLQNMLGISLNNWEVLRPTDDELNAGVLTQLGGSLLLEQDCKIRYQWKDQGICHVLNFEDVLKVL